MVSSRTTALVLLFVAGSAIATAAQRTPTPGSPLAAICNDKDLTTMCSLIKVASADPVVAQLNDPTLVATIFAPTNKGIENTRRDIQRRLGVSVQDLPNSPADAAKLLKNHIVIGQALQSSQLKKGELKTALGQEIEPETGYLWGYYIDGPVNKVRSVQRDILAGRSYIHKVDGAIVPK